MFEFYSNVLANVYGRDSSKLHVFGIDEITPLNQFPVRTNKLILNYQLGNSRAKQTEILIEKALLPQALKKKDENKKEREVEFINQLRKQTEAKGLRCFPNTFYVKPEGGGYVCYQFYAGDYTVFDIFAKYSSKGVENLEQKLSEFDRALEVGSLSEEERSYVQELRNLKRITYDGGESRIKLKQKYVNLKRGDVSEGLPKKENCFDVFKNCFHTLVEFNTKMTQIWREENEYRDVGLFKILPKEIKLNHLKDLKRINSNLDNDIYSKTHDLFKNTLLNYMLDGPDTFVQGDSHADNLVIGTSGNNYKIDIVDFEHIHVSANPTLDLVRCGNFLERYCGLSSEDKDKLWNSIYGSKESILSFKHENLRRFTEYFDDLDIYAALNKRINAIDNRLKNDEHVEILTLQNYDFWKFSLPKIKSNLISFTQNWESVIDKSQINMCDLNSFKLYFNNINEHFLK